MNRNIWTLLLISLSWLGLDESVHAAPITWGSPFELISEADINLSFGPVVYAFNGGDNIGNEDFIPTETLPTLSNPKTVTIGNKVIPFEGVDAAYGLAASWGILGTPFETFGDAVDHLTGQSGFNVTLGISNARTVNVPQVVFDPTPAMLFSPPEPADYSVSTGNSELDSILDSMIFMDSRNSLGSGKLPLEAGTLHISLNNLTPGKTYQVQVVGGADDRRYAADPNIIDPNYLATSTANSVSPIATLDDGLGNMVANIGAFLDLDGDDQGHVTTVAGTFTADAASQQLNLLLQRGRNVGFSALILTEQAMSTVPDPDFDGDGDVDGRDFLIWQRGFGLTGQVDNSFGDANNDGTVDQLDLEDWQAGYGSTPVMGLNSTVPEPSTFLLLMTVGISLTLRRQQ